MEATKAELRRAARERRRAVSRAFRDECSCSVCRTLLDRFRGQNQTIAVYLATEDEICLDEFIAQYGARLVAPRWNGVAGAYELAEISDISSLSTGHWGIREPHRTAKGVAAGDVDVWLVPGLAFTTGGERLGYGGGHYDRLLAQARPDSRKIGIAYKFQVSKNIPMESHDIKMDEVVFGGGRRRICVTGGIACGKSLFSKFLNERGIETLDADDIVHRLIPEEERKRLAKTVFSDAKARAALEARIHPLVREEFDRWERGVECGKTRISVIPLLFEVHWEKNYDIICAVICKKATQLTRMMQNRGYTCEEAEGRINAQMPTIEKAAKSQYVIHNDGSKEELERQASEFVSWLAEQEKEDNERRI